MARQGGGGGAVGQESKTRPGALAAYLLLAFALSAVFWAIIIASGSPRAEGGVLTILLMWCPGVAALLISLAYRRTLRGMGWRLGSWRHLLVSYALPPLYCLVAYGVVWAAGLGSFPNPEGVAGIARQFGLEGRPTEGIVAGWAVATGTLLVLVGVLGALGEEIGWRGFLVPELARRVSWHRAALISGGVWVLWHCPLILFADYRGDNPVWYSLATFALMAGSLSVVFTWLRLRSGSLWPPVLLHAAHNAWVQQFFDPITGDTGVTAWVIGEFGLALAIVAVVLAVVFWRQPIQPRSK